MEKNLNVRVPEQLLSDFDKACEANYTNKSEVLRRAMLDYVRKNQKEEKRTKLTYQEMVERAGEQVAADLGDLYVKLMSKAHYMATDNGLFTDNKEEWDENSQYLVANMGEVVMAHFGDLAVEAIFDIDPSEDADGAEKWAEKHGIKLLG